MSTHRVTIELPSALYRFLQEQVESGAFESQSDVIAEALLDLALASTEGAEVPSKEWLDGEIVKAMDEWRKNPEDVYTSEEVQAHLSAHSLKMQKAG